MIYREEKDDSINYKKEYLKGIEHIIRQRQKSAENIRHDYIKNIFKNQNKYRQEFIEMLGWPLVDYKKETMPEPIIEKLSDEEGYSVFRMQFEILDELKLTGLFFKANGNENEKKPLVLVQHGMLGTPELISGVYGDTTNYNNMLERVIKYGVHAFAPQLLLWSDEYGVEYDRYAIDANLKRVGSSIAAVEIFGMSRIIDYFETEGYISNFGMVGLSYGGFYTLYTAAIETRIRSAISCSFFNKRDIAGWCDWTWLKSAEKFDDAEIACLVYPRKLCIEVGSKDTTFNYKYALESFDTVKKICENVGTDWIDLIVFDGVHEFCTDDKPIEKLINDIK